MNLHKELQEIGLNEKEAKIYIALLELGKSTAQDISKKSGVNRATTYFILENLMKKGLASAENQEKKQMFLPEDPSQITTIIDQQKAELDRKKERLGSLVQQLETINAAKIDKPIVKYYLGKGGIMKMARVSFSYKKGVKMHLIYSKDELSSYLTEEESTALLNKGISAKIDMDELYSVNDPGWKPNASNECVLEKEFPLPADIAIYDDRIRIASFQDEVGIIIQNKTIAETLRSVFRLAKKGAKSLRKERAEKEKRPTFNS